MEGPERWNCMIAWKYLNKPSATVAALQDYATMRDIINITPQETKELYDRMISTGGRQLTGLPTSWNPQANENRLVKCLEKSKDAVSGVQCRNQWRYDGGSIA